MIIWELFVAIYIYMQICDTLVIGEINQEFYIYLFMSIASDGKNKLLAEVQHLWGWFVVIDVRWAFELCGAVANLC